MIREDISVGEILLFIAGIATAIGTLALAFTSYLSIQFAERTIEVGRENIELTKKGIETSQKNIELTEESIKSSRNQFIETNRPWLDIRINKTIRDDQDKKLTAIIEFVVGGLSIPAQGVSCSYRLPATKTEHSGLKVASTVMLPGPDSIFSHEHVIRDPHFTNVMRHNTPANLTITCSYHMGKSIERRFRTQAEFTFTPKERNGDDTYKETSKEMT